jgi:hypothetical protein
VMMGALGWRLQIQNKGAPAPATHRAQTPLTECKKILDVHPRYDPSTALQPGLAGR